MKEIFERLGRYFSRLMRRSPPVERTGPPHRSEDWRGIRTAAGDPYAEMRKALALTMLLG